MGVWEAYHKGVPLLGVPEITLECSRLPHRQLNLTPPRKPQPLVPKANGKKKQQTNTKHVPLSIHVVVSNMFYFDP